MQAGVLGAIKDKVSDVAAGVKDTAVEAKNVVTGSEEKPKEEETKEGN